MDISFLMLFVRILHVRSFGWRPARPAPDVFQSLLNSLCFRVICRAASRLCLFYFPPRFASRNSTFCLTDSPFVSWNSTRFLPHRYMYHSPTGSYLSMLSGRWVRGRRKVMKKPVMAIDMRRTATVLDFAVVVISTRVHSDLLRQTYLSSPSCDLEWTMRLLGSRLR